MPLRRLAGAAGGRVGGPRSLTGTQVVLNLIVASLLLLSPVPLAAQQESGWRIQPEKINIQVGEERPLQLLDDQMQELRDAKWAVDLPALADITERDGRMVVQAKAPGVVRVSAQRNGEMRFREITIWPLGQPLPLGTTRWGTHDFGRDLRDLAAVPTGDGPELFNLEQSAETTTYLRAFSSDGIQLWSWLVPEKTKHVDLVCGDWTGGALISANHANSFTLYTVGKDGKVRWQHTLAGIRKAHSIDLQHTVYILSQSPDGTVTKITGFDEITGDQKFELPLPASSERLIHVKGARTTAFCRADSTGAPIRTIASRLFVNIDGLAYVAFTQNEWTLDGGKCTPGAEMDRGNLTSSRHERILLWQIHPDGTYRSTAVEESKSTQPLGDLVSVGSPTGEIIPDGQGGVLLSVHWSHNAILRDAHDSDEYVYRLDENGAVLYKLLLPPYLGRRHDEMVLGEENRGFATRGGVLVAFDVLKGTEIWRWDSGTPEIEVFAALANGGCTVQTPAALVEVDAGGQAKELAKGKAMMDWHGNMYVTPLGPGQQ